MNNPGEALLMLEFNRIEPPAGTVISVGKIMQLTFAHPFHHTSLPGSRSEWTADAPLLAKSNPSYVEFRGMRGHVQ